MRDNLLKIGGGLLGVALIALLINRSGGVSDIISSGVTGFNKLVKTVTLQ